MKTSIFIIILLTIFICDCRRNANLSQMERATIKNDVQLVLTAMSDSMRTNGLAGWIPFLYNSPDFKWEFHGIAESYDTLVAQIRREAPRYRSITISWDSVQVEPLSDNETMLTTKYNESVTDTGGANSTIVGTVKSRLERVNGAWKFHLGHTFVDNGTRTN